MIEENATDSTIKSGVFGAIFETLGPSDLPGELRTKKSRFTFMGKDIFAGRDFDGFPHLLIPATSLGEVVPESLSAYIHLAPRELTTADGTTQAFIDLSCAAPEIDALFAPICLEISQNITNLGTNTFISIHKQIALVVDKWREVLKALAEAGQSRSAVVGLIGEMLALAALAEAKGPEALDGWFGQDKTRHDFEFSEVAYEVKASTVLSRKSCEIHGLNQLAYADGTTLELLHFQIEQAAGALCLTDLISLIEAREVSAVALRKKMVAFWPEGTNPPSWFTDFKFKVVCASRFSVDEAFPRITSSAFTPESKAHISEVRYTLTLDGLPVLNQETGSSWIKVLA
jgi:hypothetical protein